MWSSMQSSRSRVRGGLMSNQPSSPRSRQARLNRRPHPSLRPESLRRGTAASQVTHRLEPMLHHKPASEATAESDLVVCRSSPDLGVLLISSQQTDGAPSPSSQ
jgi:hypothetical protein